MNTKFVLRVQTMPYPRSQQISLGDTPYYHCVSRCVRRAYLCGEDERSGQSFEHRKQWLVDKMLQLASIFCIEICAYAVMSNHYHIVLKVNRDKALSISDQEVVERWYQLFAGNRLVDNWLKGEKQSQGEKLTVQSLIAKWRERLYGIDWFMRCLNEYMARQANREEKVTGRFWEGRYKSQALLDEGALLACMAYVDLNPIRAKMATTPEDSAFTSIQQRIKTLKQGKRKLKKSPKAKKQTQKQSKASTLSASAASSEGITATKSEYPTPKGLLSFSGFLESAQQDTDIPFDLMDYLELVDWTGRAIREDKRGAIPSHLSPIFERLGLNQEDWRDIVKDFSRHFTTAAGSIAHMQAMAAHTHRARCCTRKALMLYQ